MTERPTVYQLTNHGTAPRFNAAFAKGCGGAPIITDGILRPGPVALWGEHKFFKTLAKAIADGRTWYYGDHAYFGRGVFFRITKNALQIHGSYFEYGPTWGRCIERLEEVRKLRLEEVRKIVPVVIEPRKPPGDFILVCPPSYALSERSGFTQEMWTSIIKHRIAKATKRPVVIRTKPKTGNNTPAALLAALKGAHALVTYTSNVAIEATCAGYPAFCTGPNPVGIFGNSDLKKIEFPYVPTEAARTAWAAMLCANQWTLAEIAAGKAWKAIA
jgi:hypothetical protein